MSHVLSYLMMKEPQDQGLSGISYVTSLPTVLLGFLSFLRIPQSLRFRRKGLLWAYPGGLADFAAFWSPPAPPAPCNLASLLSSWPPGLPHPGPWISLPPLAFLSLSFLLSPPSGLSHLSLLRFCCVSLILKVLLGKVNTFGM